MRLMLQIIGVVWLGLVIGSFLNVCIDRIPVGQSIIVPRSHCMKCGHTLGILELIPVVSYLGLRGRCKHCHSHIPLRSIWIEIITGLCLGGVYYLYGFTIKALMVGVLLACLIILAVVDWQYMLLPTVVIYTGLGSGIILYSLQAVMTNQWIKLWQAAIEGIIGYSLFMFLYYVSKWLLKKEALGYGDVRLMGLIGFFVGIEYISLVLLVAGILGGIYGVILLIRKGKSESYPLGPFLSIGAGIAVFWGEPIMMWYLRNFY